MSFISSESDRTNDSSSYDESEDSIQLFENDEQKLISKDDIDQPDSVLPVEVTFARHHLGEDLGDALWNTKLRVTNSKNVAHDEGDDSIILSQLDYETIIANEVFEEMQYMKEDVENGRRISIGQLSGVFTLTNTFKLAPTIMVNETNKIKKMLTDSPVYDPFTTKSVFMSMLSLGLDLLDYTSDIVVANLLFKETSTDWWFNLTLILILLPLFLVNLFSIFWFWQDHRTKPDEIRKSAMHGRNSGLYPHKHKYSKTESRLILGSHAILMAPLFRHFQILYCGWKEKKLRQKLHNMDSTRNPDKWHSKIEGPYCPNPKWAMRQRGHLDYYTLRKYYERDAAYLGLIKAFMQDCPQLILQLFILAVRDNETLNEPSIAFYQISSIIISLVSLSWSMVCFEQSNRWANPDKPQMTLVGCFIQLFWRFFMVASRVIVLALFATCFSLELFAVLGLHWLIMTLWILMMGTNFCGSAENRRRPLSELVYNIVMGFVGIFEYLHLKDGPTRLKYIFYYLLTSAEAAALMTLWYMDTTSRNTELGDTLPVPWSKDDWYVWGSLVTVPGFFLIGLVFMFIYYNWYHPAGPMPDMKQRASLF